ncbi:unnamed protein product [Dimorphilus gyrociliatus]|uniref:BZIP domain-containing protein n=1 Tax=Dimorphilus gyrociliatus TaxID=2664684 RepID=A0A7I8WAE9_9ANNE|nr:unnamed protein product [Dimorphilus gyrociliatus]
MIKNIENHSLYDQKKPTKPRTLLLELNQNGLKMKPPIINSPDLQMLKLASPEVEKLLNLNGITTTPTPTTSILFPPKPATEEEEEYAKGFVEALNSVYAQRGGQPKFLPTPTGAKNVANTVPTEIKRENPTPIPTCVSSPPVSPVNMDNQEKLKIEHKRERNRIAARKCRFRKLERIENLEGKVKELKNINAKLSESSNQLKEQVSRLKHQISQHIHRGCTITINPTLLQ